MSIKDNAQKGKISTFIGSVIVLASIVSVFIPQLEIIWSDAVIGISVGVGLIGLVDK